MRETSKAAAATAKAAKYLFMLTFVLVSVGPILWAFISSFKTYAEINSSALSASLHFLLKSFVA